MSGFMGDSPYKIGATANGNIPWGGIVKLDTSLDFGVLAAGVGDVPFGIVPPSHRNPPYNAGGGTSLDDGYCAIAGEGVPVATATGSRVFVRSGAAITRGDKLKPDSSSRAITATPSAGTPVIAEALQSCSGADLLVECIILPIGSVS